MGFAFAAVFLLLARPNGRTLLASLVLVLPGLWLRAYASGYVRKNSELTVSGPYAHTRNPLYLGSMTIAFGFALASGSWIVFLALAALFAAIYIPTIQGEEQYLRGQFPGFDAYAAKVPRLLPRLTPAHLAHAGPAQDRGQFSPTLYLKHREYNSLMGACAIYAALALRIVFEHRLLNRPPWWP